LSRFAQESAEHQIPWLQGERFELALDSSVGAVHSPAKGDNTLTVTTHRVIRLGHAGGAWDTQVVPLNRINEIEILDVSRDSGKLKNGLLALAAGILLAWVIWQVFEVMPFVILSGGLLTLVGVWQLSGYLFPDEDGALLLHTGSHAVRQPLLTTEARRDAYLVAHRIYELIADSAPSGTAPSSAPAPNVSEEGSSDPASPPALVPPPEASTAFELAAVLTLALHPVANPEPINDIAERVARCVAATEGTTSYVTRQIIRDPSHEQMSHGDYVWDMEFAGPDRFRVAQSGWSDTGEVRERWISIGSEFYRHSGTWQKPTDPTRFEPEQKLNRHLTVGKFVGVLRQGHPTSHGLDSDGKKQYLQVRYEPLNRESLAPILGNPSPPQGILGSAIIWIDTETDLLVKAEVRVTEATSGRQLLFEQAFASYNTDLQIDRPDAPLESEPIN
jgi:hypothetical protein